MFKKLWNGFCELNKKYCLNTANGITRDIERGLITVPFGYICKQEFEYMEKAEKWESRKTEEV